METAVPPNQSHRKKVNQSLPSHTDHNIFANCCLWRQRRVYFAGQTFALVSWNQDRDCL